MTFAVALALLAGMVWDDIEDIASVNVVQQFEQDSDVVVLSIADAEEVSAPTHVEMPAPDVADMTLYRPETCPLETSGILSLIERGVLDTMGGLLASPSGGASSNLVEYARRKMLPQFFSAYRSVFKLATLMGLPRIQDEATLAYPTIVGVVSTYNPFRDGMQEGDGQTASGEPYDPGGWTAAIQVDLRNQFGGVRYGRFYQPAYALIESGDKQLIVKINDVGPLKPGRVLDLNERSMRHFDPFLTRGLLADARITLLPGEDWTPGPIGSAYAIDFAASERRAAPALAGSVESADLESRTELAGAPQAQFHSPDAGADAPAGETENEGG